MALVLGPSNALAHTPPAEAGLPNPQDVHVLLVDDEQLSRLVVCNLLRKCEYKVTVVESGAQAIDALQRNKPGTFQLVLTDVMMPEVDGLDILRFVRTNAALAELPVIMMSANEEKDAVFEAIKGGAEEYLIKPVTKKELQNIWRYVWKRVSATQLRRGQSETDLQLLQASAGSNGSGEVAAAAAAAQFIPGPSQQRQQHQQELIQAMQQLHRQHQQVVQQPDPVSSSRRAPAQQQQQQRTSGSSPMLLSQYLLHPKRIANHKESIWLFCEVLLLLQRLTAAAGAAAGAASALIRPSKLLLHHSGKVTVAAAAVTTDPQEDRLYQSPEQAASGGQDSYSLGVLLFELLNTASGTAAAGSSGVAAAAAAGSGRWEALVGLRQRRLPALFVQRYPKETTLVLSLTHPDPSARPSIQQLISHESLAAAVAVVQDRHQQRQQQEEHQRQQQQQQQTKDPDAMVFFLQTCQGKKEPEVHQLRQQVAGLEAEVAEVTAALQQLQQQGLAGGGAAAGVTLPQQQEQMAAAGSGTLGDSGAAAGSPLLQLAQHRDSNSPPSAAVSAAAADEDMRDVDDEDDDEMERRERGRSKRRRIAAVQTAAGQLLQQQQQVADQRLAAASPAAAGTMDVSNKWQNVLDKFAVLEAVYLKRKQQQQQQQWSVEQQQGSNGNAPSAAAAAPAAAATAVDSNSSTRGLKTEYLDAFADDLWAYSRFSGFAVRGTVRAAADVLGGGNAMVNAAAFDRDDEFVATAGVSKRIRIFEYSSITSSACGGGFSGGSAASGMGGYTHGAAAAVAGSSASVGVGAFTAGVGGAAGVDGIVYPVLELSSRSRLCSVVWSSYVKAHVASSDVEGVVQLWDANTGSEVAQFEEHAKRAWAVDFSRLEPTKLVSCSDDGTVKVWSVHQDSSVATLQLHNNVCSVQFSPENPHLVAAGCSNARIYLYDLRQTAQALACVPGHSRAVSYVRWLNGNELVSASIDNSIKLWSVPALVSAGTVSCSSAAKGPAAAAAAANVAAACSATYAGHTNSRNFIGLAVLPGSPGSSSNSRGGYIACGSETNEVFAYHSAVPVPITSYSFSAALAGHSVRRGTSGFGDLETLAELEGPGTAFVSCVTWNKRAGTLVAANSAGHIKVLELV